MMFCAGGAITSLAIGDPVIVPLAYAAGAGCAVGLARRWSRLYPAPMPHAMKWILYFPHPGMSPAALHRVLEPHPGERILEIGPGIGHHAIPMARRLTPGGCLDALDVQPEMLEELRGRAEAGAVQNIVAQTGNAERLPYGDGTFDAAYLITVLGEIPNPEAALKELSRVLKPGGRIVIGEMFLDPDYVSPAKLQQLAEAAALRFVKQAGVRFSYLARLERK